MATPERSPGRDVVVRRSGAGWVVTAGSAPGAATTDEPVDDLVSALVLADLLAADIDPGPRPPRASGDSDETGRLRTAVKQLEHALAARVVVEQAIGVLAERAGTEPRVAFEQMRRTARSQGRKVHDLAGVVVASVTDPTVALPHGLPRRRR